MMIGYGYEIYDEMQWDINIRSFRIESFCFSGSCSEILVGYVINAENVLSSGIAFFCCGPC